MIAKTGDYVVASQYSQTLINERNLINLLTDVFLKLLTI